MHRAIMGLLLAATATSPLAAQDWNRGERRDNRQELRQDRREVRQDRQDVRREVRQGDRQGAYAAQRELGQDRREFRQDAREAQRDRVAVQNGTANSWAERQRDLRAERRDDFRGDRFDNRDRRGWNGNDRGRYEWRGQGRWDNRWREDYRYDWQGWRNQNRGIFRLPRYSAPRGYSYRRWSPGFRIEPFFYGRSYWISDPWRYRLPPAYGDYRWVRYYDDVALVDIRTGLIADVLYSFFW